MTAIAVCYATTPLLQRFKKLAPYLLLILLVANALIYMMLIVLHGFHFIPQGIVMRD